VFPAAILAAALPQVLRVLEKEPADTLASAIAVAAVPYLTNPAHRAKLAAVLIATAAQLQPSSVEQAV
jgi:hypothetical protein